MWNPKSSSFLHGNIPLELLKTWGGGSTQQSLTQGGSAPRSNPLFIYTLSLQWQIQGRGLGGWRLGTPLSQGLDAPPFIPTPLISRTGSGTALTEKVAFVFPKPFIGKCEMVPLSHQFRTFHLWLTAVKILSLKYELIIKPERFLDFFTSITCILAGAVMGLYFAILQTDMTGAVKIPEVRRLQIRARKDLKLVAQPYRGELVIQP